jgi:hypothetical protein
MSARRIFSFLILLAVLAAPIAAAYTYGGGGAACTNQLVLDYSNSHALIGQAWGQ